MTREEAITKLKNFADHCYPNEEFLMAIKALETLEEFEKAQIITGGRLNGRTYAYKCGLEDGKRKALEQEPKETWSIKDVATTFERHGLMTEQEPCEDCISRADARHLIAEVNRKTLGCISTKAFKTLYKGIEELPSVTPKPKIDFEHKAEIVISQLRADRDRLQEAIEKIRGEIIETFESSECAEESGCLNQILEIIDKHTVESEE